MSKDREWTVDLWRCNTPKLPPQMGEMNWADLRGNELPFLIILKLGRRAHHDRFFPTFGIILPQTSLRRQLFKVSNIRNGIHCSLEPGPSRASLEPGPTLVDMVTTGFGRHHINKGWAWFEAIIYIPALDTSHATCCYWRRLLGKHAGKFRPRKRHESGTGICQLLLFRCGTLSMTNFSSVWSPFWESPPRLISLKFGRLTVIGTLFPRSFEWQLCAA